MVKGVTPAHEAVILLLLGIAFSLLVFNLNLYPYEKLILFGVALIIFTIFFSSALRA